MAHWGAFAQNKKKLLLMILERAVRLGHTSKQR